MHIVTINENNNSIECKGHTIDPVVCHALSALVTAVANRLEDKVEAVVTLDDDEDAYVKIELPVGCNGKDKEYYLDYLDFLIQTIEMIDNEHPWNIKIKRI